MQNTIKSQLLPVNADAKQSDGVDTRLSEADDSRLETRLRGLAKDMIENWSKIPDWNRPFMLAKVLRGYYPENESVASICELARNFGEKVCAWDIEDLTDGLLAKWNLIRDGGDAWDDAWDEAKRSRSEFSPCPDDGKIRLVRAIHLLWVESEGKPIPIPTARIAKSMGKSIRQASNIREAMARRGIISNSGEGYSFKSGKADTFVFVARIVS